MDFLSQITDLIPAGFLHHGHGDADCEPAAPANPLPLPGEVGFHGPENVTIDDIEPHADDANIEPHADDADIDIDPHADDANIEPHADDAHIEPHADDANIEPHADDAHIEPHADGTNFGSSFGDHTFGSSDILDVSDILDIDLGGLTIPFGNGIGAA